MGSVQVQRGRKGIREKDRKLSASIYRKSSIKPPGGLIYFKPFWGLLNRDGTLFDRGIGGGGGAYLIVSVLHKKVEYKVDKLKDKKVVNASKDQKQIPSSSW